MQKIFKTWSSYVRALAFVGFLLWVGACGGAGQSPSSDAGSIFGSSAVRGSITTQSGANLSGWVLALVDVTTEITRTASVDSSGIYSFRGVDLSKAYTLVLLSPTLRVSAVMFQPISTTAEFYKQNFTILGEILPPLVVNGSSMTFQTETGIQMTSQLFLDQLQDGIADGMGASLSLAQFPLSSDLGSDDLDSDGIKNIFDSDVDGDGVVNVFDPDDDGDQTLDVFDADSNGDLIEDKTQEKSDQHFDVGVEWVTVNYRRDVAAAKTTLSFVTKLRAGVNPVAVQVLGPTSLFKDALVEYIDADGNAVSQAFEGRLLDEGLDGDSSAQDLIFGRTITLNAAAVLTADTVVFIQLAFGTATDAVKIEYPYMFSLGTPSDISITVTNDRSVSLGSTTFTPFGATQSYWLSYQVFNDSDELVHTTTASEVIPPTFPLAVEVPTGLSQDASCTFQATARSVDRIPGYSNYTVLSEKDPTITACP